MLVLNRKCDQEILIAGKIRIKILSVKGNTVRIGIEAPDEVPILRGELTSFEDKGAIAVREPSTSFVTADSTAALLGAVEA